ncbi:conserved serine-threonine rich protein [Aspergillus sclerotialis]|uniref:Conserved serine-threonine rich protein n=1 Tax=Aspergillus sclerotialis TaxID=2070753 RepID=A0A3A2ZYF6_9EURO|nr:conserved serine-threonine rich protein [Aspergillus sclerotialis]
MPRLISTRVVRYPNPSTRPDLQSIQARNFCHFPRHKRKGKEAGHKYRIRSKLYRKHVDHPFPGQMIDNLWWKVFSRWYRLASHLESRFLYWMLRPHKFHSHYHSQAYDDEKYDGMKNRESQKSKDNSKGMESEIDVFDYYWKHPIRWAYSCGSFWGVGYGAGMMKFATARPGRTADVEVTNCASAKKATGTHDVQRNVAAQADREFDPISGRMLPKEPNVVDVSYKDSSDNSKPKSDAVEDRQDDVCNKETNVSSADVSKSQATQGEPLVHTAEGEESADVNTNNSPEDTPPISNPTGNGNETPRVIIAEPPKPENELSSGQSIGSSEGETSSQQSEGIASISENHSHRAQAPGQLDEGALVEDGHNSPSEASQQQNFFKQDEMDLPKRQSELYSEQDFLQGEASKPLSEKDVIDVDENYIRYGQEWSPYKADGEKALEQEDLKFLSASDVRAPYDSKKPETETYAEKQKVRRALEDELDCYVDLASGVDPQDIRARYKHHMHDSEVDEVPLAASGSELQSSDYPSANQSTSTPAMYRILAHDSSTLKMAISETSSSQHAPDETLHLTEVLSRLNNAAKFIPYFADMHKDGYEIVSGGGDILVFKKVREVGERSKGETVSASGSSSPDATPYEAGALPEDVTFERDAMEVIDNEQSQVEQPTQSQRKVQRQETVYTGGPPNWSPYPPPTHDQSAAEADNPAPKKVATFRKALRRMFLTGGATAATCYAIGVVSEYFRTGGQDGHGIDGFTEFESERRRRN